MWMGWVNNLYRCSIIFLWTPSQTLMIAECKSENNSWGLEKINWLARKRALERSAAPTSPLLPGTALSRFLLSLSPPFLRSFAPYNSAKSCQNCMPCLVFYLNFTFAPFGIAQTFGKRSHFLCTLRLLLKIELTRRLCDFVFMSAGKIIPTLDIFACCIRWMLRASSRSRIRLSTKE